MVFHITPNISFCTTSGACEYVVSVRLFSAYPCLMVKHIIIAYGWFHQRCLWLTFSCCYRLPRLLEFSTILLMMHVIFGLYLIFAGAREEPRLLSAYVAPTRRRPHQGKYQVSRILVARLTLEDKSEKTILYGT